MADLCDKCGEPLLHGVDIYCATNGCENELSLANLIRADRTIKARLREIRIERVKEALKGKFLALVYPMTEAHWDGMARAAVDAWEKGNA